MPYFLFRPLEEHIFPYVVSFSTSTLCSLPFVSPRHGQQEPLPYQSRLAGLSVDQCEASWTCISPAQDRPSRTLTLLPSFVHSPRLINLAATLFRQCNHIHVPSQHPTAYPPTRKPGRGQNRKSAGPSVVTGLAPALRAPVCGGRASVGDDEICRHSQASVEACCC